MEKMKKRLLDSLTNGFLTKTIGLFFSLIPFDAFSAQTCLIEIPFSQPGKYVELKNCTLGGNFNVIAFHVRGKFVIDLHKLTSGSYLLDTWMREHYFQHRYAVLSIYSFDLGDKFFLGIFRLNSKSKFIKSEVISSSKSHLESFFSINLRDYGYSLDKEVNILLRIYPDNGRFEK